jgi:hypothetical protein
MSRPFLTVATRASLGAICLFSAACSQQKPKYLTEFAPMMQDYGAGIPVDGEPEVRDTSAEGNGLEVRTKPLSPGEVSTLSVKLERGNYELYCPMGAGSHNEKGLHAVIQVTE